MIFGALGAAPLGDDAVFASGPAAQSLTLPFLTDADTLFAPAVSLAGGTTQSLSLPFLADGDTLYAPSVAPGAVALALPALASGAALFGPLVAPGAVTLGLPFLVDADFLFSPIITLPALPPAERIAFVAGLARAARVEGLPRILAPGATARIILIK